MSKLTSGKFYKFLRGEYLLPKDISKYSLAEMFVDNGHTRYDVILVDNVELTFEVTTQKSSCCIWGDSDSEDAEFVEIPASSHVYTQEFKQGFMKKGDKWVPFFKNSCFYFIPFGDGVEIGGDWSGRYPTTFRIID